MGGMCPTRGKVSKFNKYGLSCTFERFPFGVLIPQPAFAAAGQRLARDEIAPAASRFALPPTPRY